MTLIQVVTALNDIALVVPENFKGMVVDRDEFEKMKEEYYEIRGWDVNTGLQKRAQMEELDLGDMLRD